MTRSVVVCLSGIALLALTACGTDGFVPATMQFRHALTGDNCEPDPVTYVPSSEKPDKQDGLEKNPLDIPGDNEDDAASGRTDCLGDGNSGHGNDTPGCVPPGCDAYDCCEVGSEPEPELEPEPEPEPEPADCSELDDDCGYGQADVETGECIYVQSNGDGCQPV